MLTVLFTICMIWFVGKFFYIWLKSILGNHEITLSDYFLSSDIDWMVVGGLMYIAFPLLIIGGIIGLVTSHS